MVQIPLKMVRAHTGGPQEETLGRNRGTQSMAAIHPKNALVADLISTPKGGALVTRTPTKRTPKCWKHHIAADADLPAYPWLLTTPPIIKAHNRLTLNSWMPKP